MGWPGEGQIPEKTQVKSIICHLFHFSWLAIHVGMCLIPRKKHTNVLPYIVTQGNRFVHHLPSFPSATPHAHPIQQFLFSEWFSNLSLSESPVGLLHHKWLGSPPEVSHPVNLGWGPRIRIFNKCQVLLMLWVQIHSEDNGSGEYCLTCAALTLRAAIIER